MMKMRLGLISRDVADDRAPRPRVAGVPLSQLAAGAVARLHAADIASSERAMLRALGLTSRSVLRVCKSGDPCIVQVRTTRIGLSRTLADSIIVVPEPGR